MKKTIIIIIAMIAFITTEGQVKQNDQTKLEYSSFINGHYYAKLTNKQNCTVPFVLRNCILDTVLVPAGSSIIIELDTLSTCLEAKALTNCREPNVDVHGVVLCMENHVLALKHFSNIRFTRVDPTTINLEMDVSDVTKNTQAIIQYTLDGVNMKNASIFVPAHYSHVSKQFTIK